LILIRLDFARELSECNSSRFGRSEIGDGCALIALRIRNLALFATEPNAEHAPSRGNWHGNPADGVETEP
jgi:hypothetical protein